MAKKSRSRSEVLARFKANGPAITPVIPDPQFTDSEIDSVPLALKRDCVRYYIEQLERDNKAMRQVLSEMSLPLTPKPIAHPAKKGKL